MSTKISGVGTAQHLQESQKKKSYSPKCFEITLFVVALLSFAWAILSLWVNLTTVSPFSSLYRLKNFGLYGSSVFLVTAAGSFMVIGLKLISSCSSKVASHSREKANQHSGSKVDSKSPSNNEDILPGEETQPPSGVGQITLTLERNGEKVVSKVNQNAAETLLEILRQSQHQEE